MFASRIMAAALISAFTLGATAPSFAKNVATVNGVGIPEERVELLAKDAIERGQPDSPDLRKGIIERLIMSEVLAQEGSKKGLDKKPEFQASLEILKQQALAQAAIREYIKSNPIAESAVKAEYDKLKGDASKQKEYRARHILVKEEKLANDLTAQLKKGASFEALAKKHSLDGSKENGGDLGWANPDAFVKPFADALRALQKGQQTQKPVQTQFGWHLIKLDDVRDLKGPSYEEIKPQIQDQLQRKQFDELVKSLREKAKVEQ